jgi:RNA polymerase sigma-70 factor (ECF subfamily)
VNNDLADDLPRALTSADAALEAEFEARLTDSSTLVFRVAYSVLRHREDAEDVAQDAFVRAHRSFRRLRDRASFRAWIVRTTWRLALDRRRSDGRRNARELAAESSASPPTAEDTLVALERSTRLWRAIDRLPERLRLVVVLAAIEEQTVGDVAALLQIPEGTVKSRLFEARRRLQELLQ